MSEFLSDRSLALSDDDKNRLKPRCTLNFLSADPSHEKHSFYIDRNSVCIFRDEFMMVVIHIKSFSFVHFVPYLSMILFVLENLLPFLVIY